MGLTQQSVKKQFYSLFLLLCMCLKPVIIFAGWSGPEEITQGSWGADENQFGITYQDTEDFFPHFDVTTGRKIVIRDGTNERIKIYNSSGALELIVPYKTDLDYKDLTIADTYGFSGDFIGYGEGGANYFYRADQKVYIKFTPTGQLIKTSAERPSELGNVTEKPLGGGRYNISIAYPDITYSILGGPFERYQRDAGGRLNAITGNYVKKYDQCGKALGSLALPLNESTLIRPGGGGFEERRALIAEFGEPVVAPKGDVYTWKRTPDKYSILKWTWVDDSNVPTGPDAPSGLTVTPSFNGILLTWIASPQDPGCVTGYEISRATSAGGVGSTIATVNAGTVKFNNTDAAAGTMYYYKVRAVAGKDLSPYTTTVSGKR